MIRKEGVINLGKNHPKDGDHHNSINEIRECETVVIEERKQMAVFGLFIQDGFLKQDGFLILT